MRADNANAQDARLIILQRNGLTGRALARCLAPLFAETRVTTSPHQAEVLLNTPGSPPTDLICGQRFGDDDPSGVAWIAHWRATAASLRRAVLVTAEPPTMPVAGIDAVFDKPVAAAALQRFFAEMAVEVELPSVSIPSRPPRRESSRDLA